MRFKDGIKLGAAIYIGWHIAKGIDYGLDAMLKEADIYDKMIRGIRSISDEKADDGKMPIGFHPSND